MAIHINKTNRLLLATLCTLLALCLGLVYHQNKEAEIPASALNSGAEINPIDVFSTPEPLEYDAADEAPKTILFESPSPETDKIPDSNLTEKAPEPESTPRSPHDGFVYLKDAFPNAKFDVRYSTSHNFTGKIVEGYLSDNISLSEKAAEALKKASDTLEKKGYGILIYDAYRPKRAVDSFIVWGNQPENNLTKAEFYPDFEKSQLFKLGYLAKRSAHSRGSTIDLTIFDLKTGEPLDMGSPYDFLGPVSNHGSKLISETQTQNRNILKDAMKAAGFKELRTEWWHYELINEPFPETFFDFVIE